MEQSLGSAFRGFGFKGFRGLGIARLDFGLKGRLTVQGRKGV